jgi:Xaa-Pro dipeptidase
MQGLNGVQGILGIPQPINEPPFTLEERDRRWATIRELMQERGLDVIVVFTDWLTSDTLYISDAQGLTIFPRDEEPTLVLGGEGCNFAVEQPSWMDDTISATEFGAYCSYGEVAVSVLRRRGLLGKKIGIVGLRSHYLASVRQPDGYASYTSVKAIADAATQPIVDATDVLGEARYVKSEEEIQRLAAAVRVAEASAAAMVATAECGIAQAEVFAQMLVAQVRAGADALHIAWMPGVWGSRRHRYVTTPPGKLTPATYVATELMPEIRGYQSQVTQPMVVGEPTSQAKEIFELNAAAFDRALTLMQPGSTWGEVETGVKAVADRTDFKIQFLVHGRGLGNDGPLLIPTASHGFSQSLPIVENTVMILKPFAVPRELEHAGNRPYDVTWGDTIVVRANGGERLGTRERRLPVVPAT